MTTFLKDISVFILFDQLGFHIGTTGSRERVFATAIQLNMSSVIAGRRNKGKRERYRPKKKVHVLLPT